MKRLACFTAISFIASAGVVSGEERIRSVDTEELPLKRAGLDAKTQKILAQFANIVLGFIGIVQNPNDASNVKDRVSEMVNNAVNIVNTAVTKGELSLDASEEEIEAFARDAIRRKLIVID